MRPVQLSARAIVLLLGAALLPGVATTAPAAAATGDQTINGVASPTWQTDDTVTTLAYNAQLGLVYAGGYFTQVRDNAGANATARTNLAAFGATSGALAAGFNVTLNGLVNDIAVSPGGTVVYLAGDFTTVNGQPRNSIAAVDSATGQLVAGFTADAPGEAAAIEADGDGLWVSGGFTTVNGTGKSRFARLDPVTGAVVGGFTASLDVPALAIDRVPVTGGGFRLLVGGSFTTVNGQATGGMAAVDPTTGSVLSWAANTTQPINTVCSARVTTIEHSGTTAVIGAEGDAPGCFEGTYAATTDTGAVTWLSNCLGATQAVAIVGGLVYKGSHQHDCAYTVGDSRGGYAGSQDPGQFVHYRLTAQSLATGGFAHWAPDTNAAGNRARVVGPRAMVAAGNQVWVGGDFTTVNRAAHQGLTRFAAGSGSTPRPVTQPTVLPTQPGRLRVTWPATYDADNGTLTYTLYRGTTAIYSVAVESWPWTRPTMRFDDRVPAGRAYGYSVVASDGTHATARSAATTGTASAASRASYAATVVGLHPAAYYRLDNAIDSSGRGNTLIAGGALTPGTVDGGRGRVLNGGAYGTSTNPLTLSTFSVSTWFRTTSTRGGTLLAMSTARSGTGGTTDRGLILDSNGNLVFQLRSPGSTALGPNLRVARRLDQTWRDNRWHLAVGTWNGSTAALYVDGVLRQTSVGTAANNNVPMYLRLGYANTTAFRSTFGLNYDASAWPDSQTFTGYLDDPAVFSGALSGAQVRALYFAGVDVPVAAPPPPVVPATCFGAKPTIVSRTGGVVRGTRKADVIAVAVNRPARVLAKGGNDRVCGASVVTGGQGNDKLSYAGGTLAGTLKGGKGNDKITGGSAADRILGGAGRDVLRGGTGNDVLTGGAAADRLLGRGGNDSLVGGPGRDTGNGGPGTDRCRGVERAKSCP